jgi:hypothetical protein
MAGSTSTRLCNTRRGLSSEDVVVCGSAKQFNAAPWSSFWQRRPATSTSCELSPSRLNSFAEQAADLASPG